MFKNVIELQYQTSSLEDMCLYGDSHVFAYLLSMIKNAHMGVIIERWVVNDEPVERLVHSFCTTSDELTLDTEVFDAKGKCKLKEMLDHFCSPTGPLFRIGILERPETVFSNYTSDKIESLTEVFKEIREFIENNKDKYL